MKNHSFRFLSVALLSLVLAFGASSSAFGAATITILNNDAAGVGFNDPTAVAPVGGNAGTTLGQQRLIAFQSAADKWGATLTSPVTIVIRAQWSALTCTATTAVLGSAGAINIYRDFVGAPFTGTWYNESIDGALTGVDPDVGPEINANFNINLGQPGCLDGIFFYLGLDNNHGANVDLVAVLLHEFSHGLGFQTFTNGSTGAQNGGFPTIYDRFLMSVVTGKSWLQMTNAERAASAIVPHKLAWDGPRVTIDLPGTTAFGVPVLTVNSPPAIAGDYQVSTAVFGPGVTLAGITGNIIQALDDANPTGPTTFDGCTPFTNAAAVSGNIALIDRGTCTFKTKALNAQNAGATAVIIVNNVAGAPPTMADDPTIVTPITVSTVQITMPDGDLIKAQLGTGVNATIAVDPEAGDPLGKALVFTPNPIQSGSSVSHWDSIASPNQLMEPAINGDLTHNVTPPSDLTFSQLRDIGWLTNPLPNAIAATTGNNQSTLINTPFAIPFSVTISPAVANLIVTFTSNNGTGGANGTFTGTNARYATATTNAAGLAVAPVFTANGVVGSYVMNATVPGAGTVAFNLNNSNGAVTPTPSPSTPTPTPPPATPTPTPTPPPATPTPTPPPATPTPSATPIATPRPQPLNLSTRMLVRTGDQVGIGGFIITGSSNKHVLLRAIGPSLVAGGVPAADVLADPVMELHGPGAFVTITNDNWRSDQESDIIATGAQPTNDLESAIVATLAPGTYTAIVRGNGANAAAQSGVGLVEVYDLDGSGSGSKLGNISTRAFCGAGGDVVIAGFILGGGVGVDSLVIRGIGPSLTLQGVPSPLADPTLELHNGSGTLLLSDDNWQDNPAQAALISAAGLAPTDSHESAIYATLPPGDYTAILAGLNSGTGNGLVEVYDVGDAVSVPTPSPGVPTPTPSAPPITPTPPPASPTPSPAVFTENFDGVTAPALPPGWTVENAPVAGTTPIPPTGAFFVTSTASPAAGPNCAFVVDQGNPSDKRLISPNIAITTSGANQAVLTFQNKFNMELSDQPYDGGVLEVSSPNINGGAFTDVEDAAVGGSIPVGDYTGVIDCNPMNHTPLACRNAWTGISGGGTAAVYITSEVHLGTLVNGQTIKLRFRAGSDDGTIADPPDPGWRIDSLSLVGGVLAP